jgi:radical SAM enzyme (TIGR01210 family)
MSRTGAISAVDYDFVNDELNEEAREIRRDIPMRANPGDLEEYIRCWSEEDVIEGRPCNALVVILKTRGCTWALAGGCTMCGYANESAWQKVTEDQLVTQFEKGWRKYRGEELVKIYTSGSFVDRHEVMVGAQERILEMIGRERAPDDAPPVVIVQDVDTGRADARNPSHESSDAELDADDGTATEQGPDSSEKKGSSRKNGPGVRKVAFESLPGFIQEDTFPKLTRHVPLLEVGIGVESSNDRVLTDSINKGHGFGTFPKAAKICRDHGVSVKAYLMCKPPYLTEADALADATQTIIDAAPYSNVVSLNPTNIQGRTVVDALFKRGGYRATWLWTLVHALLEGDKVARDAGYTGIIKSDVIAAGKERGAHNCRECNDRVVKYMKKYKDTQDRKWLEMCLEKVQCKCRKEWELMLELGELIPAYGL